MVKIWEARAVTAPWGRINTSRVEILSESGDTEAQLQCKLQPVMTLLYWPVGKEVVGEKSPLPRIWLPLPKKEIQKERKVLNALCGVLNQFSNTGFQFLL